MSKLEPGKIVGREFGSGRLLRDIEEISKALYVHNTQPKALIAPPARQSKSIGEPHSPESKSKYLDEDLLQNDKKFSIWNWKPFKALTHIRSHRLSCYFFLHVHSIEGFPLNFNDLSVSVHWKRKDEVLRTCAAHICEGMAKFEETLMHRCSVYISKSSLHDDSARYEPKVFLLYASVVGAPGLDIGKHWIDLTRLLPLTLEELEKEKRSSGKWMTSFKLAGKANGAMMNVSFGFSLSGDNFLGSSNFGKVPNLLKGTGSSDNTMLQRLGSVPRNSIHGTHIHSPSLDIKVLNGVLPYGGSEITRSITFLYQKLDEGKLYNSKSSDSLSNDVNLFDSKSEFSTVTAAEYYGYESDDSEFTIIDQGIEIPTKVQLKMEEYAVQSSDGAIETIDVAEIFKGDDVGIDKEIECKTNDEVDGNAEFETVVDGSNCGENATCTNESTIEELESYFHNLAISVSPELNISLDKCMFFQQENLMESMLGPERGIMVKSLALDDVTESIADDFINLLEIEQNELDLGSDSLPESPRERLLRQFEKEALSSGDHIFNLDKIAEQADLSGDFDLLVHTHGADVKHDGVSPTMQSKRKAKMLEDLETEALMREWGLNERAFQNSPRTSSGAFGSPVYLNPEEPAELPPLGEGLGSILRTKGGGFLRSMNPSLFKNTKNGESLIMQVSSSVVLPAAMGSSSKEILQCWALVGAERIFLQAKELMPLEDITGKTLQQVAWEPESGLEILNRGHLLRHGTEVGNNVYMGRDEAEELPSGIYYEMDSEYIPLGDLTPLAMDKIQSLSIEGLRIQSGTSDDEAPSSISVRSIGEILASSSKNIKPGKSSNSVEALKDIDALIGLSISLDEWIQLDSGVVGNECEINDRVSKILAAHCANCTDPTTNEIWSKLPGKRCGYLCNNFTIAVQVLLRDPFRDYETVGTSMLALIQVERYVPESGISEQKENRNEKAEGIPRFKITEVHVAGLKGKPGKKQQSTSRWLHSSGMVKTKRYSTFRSNAIVRSSSQLIRKVKHEDVLWSISSYVYGAVAKWKELSQLNLHIRNPDIVFE